MRAKIEAEIIEGLELIIYNEPMVMMEVEEDGKKVMQEVYQPSRDFQIYVFAETKEELIAQAPDKIWDEIDANGFICKSFELVQKKKLSVDEYGVELDINSVIVSPHMADRIWTDICKSDKYIVRASKHIKDTAYDQTGHEG